MIYVAQWPVLDDERTLTDLIAQAWPDAVRMMLRDGYEPSGKPQWSTREHARQLFLDLHIPVGEATNGNLKEVA